MGVSPVVRKNELDLLLLPTSDIFLFKLFAFSPVSLLLLTVLVLSLNIPLFFCYSALGLAFKWTDLPSLVSASPLCKFNLFSISFFFLQEKYTF